MNRIDVDTAHRIWNEWISRAGCESETRNPCDLIRMVEDELEKRSSQYGALAIDRYNQPWHSEMEKRKPEPPGVVRVRDLFIIDSGGHLWIGETGGEGGEFDKDKFYEVLRDFYRENF